MTGAGRTAVVVLGVLAMVLAGCTTPDDGPVTTPTRPTTKRPLFQDERLRPVRMTSGKALGYVQPETASQILCQLLDKDEWQRLLDGEIGRRPLNAPDAGCHIATELGMVAMQLVRSDVAFEGDSTVAGRPAAVATTDHVVFTLALTDDALRPAPRQSYPVRRVLELQVIGGELDQQRDIGARVLEKIVPLLVKDGDPLPDIDDRGRVRYVSTPAASEFVDLPTPVQALRLCTVVEQVVSGARVADALDKGECRLRVGQGNIVVSADHLRHPADYPIRIAGKAAKALLDPPVVRVRLRDDADVELYVSAPDSVALAEKLVPDLTAT
ncbi:hypothetical protein [Actinophytocola sp. KF-1]